MDSLSKLKAVANDQGTNSSGIANKFIQSLESKIDPIAIEKEFGQLTKALTTEAFKKIKILEQEKSVSADKTKQNSIDQEIDHIKNNLIKSVAKIAVLSDNYKNEE